MTYGMPFRRHLTIGSALMWTLAISTVSPDAAQAQQEEARPVEGAGTGDAPQPETREPEAVDPASGTNNIPNMPKLPKITEADRKRLAEVRDELITKWSKIDRLRLRIDTSSSFKRGDVWDNTEGGGFHDFLRKDGKKLIRAESRVQPVNEPGQVRFNMPSTYSLLVSDGDYVYMFREQGKSRKAYKYDLDYNQIPRFGADEVFADLDAFPHLRVKEEDEIGPRSVYVIEGAPEAGFPVVNYYFDKEMGCVLRIVIDDSVNNRRLELSVVTIEHDPTFPDDHFDFDLPEGVELVDQTLASVQKDRTRSPAKEPSTEPAKEAEASEPAKPD